MALLSFKSEHWVPEFPLPPRLLEERVVTVLGFFVWFLFGWLVFASIVWITNIPNSNGYGNKHLLFLFVVPWVDWNVIISGGRLAGVASRPQIRSTSAPHLPMDQWLPQTYSSHGNSQEHCLPYICSYSFGWSPSHVQCKFSGAAKCNPSEWEGGRKWIMLIMIIQSV